MNNEIFEYLNIIKKVLKKQMHFLLIFLIVLLLMGSFSFVSSEFRG
jgi:hypothetical protein